MENKVVDKVGQEIVVGGYIAYAYMEGYSVGLRIAKVTAIKQAKAYDSDTEPRYHFTVLAISDAYGNPRLLSKKTTIQSNDKIVVLSPEQVPQTYKDLLNANNTNS